MHEYIYSCHEIVVLYVIGLSLDCFLCCLSKPLSFHMSVTKVSTMHDWVWLNFTFWESNWVYNLYFVIDLSK